MYVCVCLYVLYSQKNTGTVSVKLSSNRIQVMNGYNFWKCVRVKYNTERCTNESMRYAGAELSVSMMYRLVCKTQIHTKRCSLDIKPL